MIAVDISLPSTNADDLEVRGYRPVELFGSPLHESDEAHMLTVPRPRW